MDNHLDLHESQRTLLPSNLYSIAEAQFYLKARSRTIMHQGEIVGYALYGIDVVSGLWKVFRLMIDARHQRKGLGLAAMQMILNEIAREPDSTEVLIVYQSGNRAAAELYEKLGFVVTERGDNHVYARLFRSRD